MANITITLPTNNEVKVTLDTEWKWIPSYEDVAELMKLGKSDWNIYGAWKNKGEFAIWYLKNVELLSHDLMQFVDINSLADYLLGEHSDILMVMKSGSVVQLDYGLYPV